MFKVRAISAREVTPREDMRDSNSLKFIVLNRYSVNGEEAGIGNRHSANGDGGHKFRGMNHCFKPIDE